MKMRQQVQAGFQFGQLTLIEQFGISGHTRKPMWLCQCICGEKKVIRLSSLKRGSVTSCGCKRKNRAKIKEEIPIRDQTLVRRINELAKQSDVTPQAWVEELLEDWIQEHRMGKFTPDPDRHTKRSGDKGWSQFEDIYNTEDVQEVLL